MQIMMLHHGTEANFQASCKSLLYNILYFIFLGYHLFSALHTQSKIVVIVPLTIAHVPNNSCGY